MKLDTDSLSHTKWNCKYHIIFAPKYRRQVIYGKIKADIEIMLRKLCEYKQVEIIEAEACKDHIHMLVSIPPKISVFGKNCGSNSALNFIFKLSSYNSFYNIEIVIGDNYICVLARF